MPRRRRRCSRWSASSLRNFASGCVISIPACLGPRNRKAQIFAGGRANPSRFTSSQTNPDTALRISTADPTSAWRAGIAKGAGERKLDAVVRGDDRGIPVWLPWTVFFDYAIYGRSETPLECYANTGPDSMTSHPGFSAPQVAAGEVQDRYRNDGPLQGIGYPMFTLQRLIDGAEVLRIAGFDPYGHRGRHGQSIEAALAYYACFGKGAGFAKSVTAENSALCPNAAQYYGKIVDGVDQNVAFGAYRFPNNHSIVDIEADAKVASSSGPFSLDAILFGKWRD
jgi:hypothetical protein